MDKEVEVLSTREIMKRYPRITAHIITESLGYATPTCAANILKNAREGNENYCEWIYSCYNKDPLKAVQSAIRNRHHHKGYMAEYRHAKVIVEHAIKTGREPLSSSWF